ncbi:MAG: FkbM family methyltransferase [bacterium]|nr:FkbM family methyltransferase [bacterium]
MGETTESLDLCTFIKNELGPRGLPTFAVTARKEQIAWRTTGWRAWRAGEIRFHDFLRNLLPGRFKSAALQRKLQTFLHGEVEEVFRRAGLYRGTATLFGEPFSATSPRGFKNWLLAIKLINEVILRDEYQARLHIADGAVVIDAGANIGTFAVLSATLAPRGRIYAFEPAHTTFQTLERNLKPYPNAAAVHSALGNRIGSAELLVNESFDAGNSLTESGVPAELIGSYFHDKETVPITTIDAFVREHNLPRVDFIKMDTEGFEKQILEGAKETIHTHRPAMSLSAYHKPGDPERLKAIIAGYCPEYRFVLKNSPELDLICTVAR